MAKMAKMTSLGDLASFEKRSWGVLRHQDDNLHDRFNRLNVGNNGRQLKKKKKRTFGQVPDGGWPPASRRRARENQLKKTREPAE